MHYGTIKRRDIADGRGVRVTLFVSGCTHRCKGCFNPETWNFDYGKPFCSETENELIEELRPPYVDGLTLLGGEPFEPDNQRRLVPFLKRVRAELPEKDVWCYTGGVYERELLSESPWRCEVTDEMLSLIDVLVDGRFIEEQKDVSLVFRGSSNQRIIDLEQTRRVGAITLWHSPEHDS